MQAGFLRVQTQRLPIDLQLDLDGLLAQLAMAISDFPCFCKRWPARFCPAGLTGQAEFQ